MGVWCLTAAALVSSTKRGKAGVPGHERSKPDPAPGAEGLASALQRWVGGFAPLVLCDFRATSPWPGKNVGPGKLQDIVMNRPS